MNRKPRFSVKVLVILVVKVVLVVEDLVKAGTGFLSFMWLITSYASSIVSPVIHAVVHLDRTSYQREVRGHFSSNLTFLALAEV